MCTDHTYWYTTWVEVEGSTTSKQQGWRCRSSRSTTSKQHGRWRRSSKVKDDVVDELDEKDASSRVKTLPKNLIRPLPVQDLKGRGFRRPALPIADARQRSRWRQLQCDTVVSRGENLTQVGLRWCHRSQMYVGLESSGSILVPTPPQPSDFSCCFRRHTIFHKPNPLWMKTDEYNRIHGHSISYPNIILSDTWSGTDSSNSRRIHDRTG
jgi:hypothetical protein